jgi:hypothetical protein
MKISGFTMVRNAEKYYFPIRESILSVLSLVDEFIVALGNCDADDKTLEIIKSISSEKIKIYDRRWSEQSFIDGKIFAEETSFALSKCTGDWCLYLQADEVIHENDLPQIKNACEKELSNSEVEGFLFKYYHFWGDYEHYLPFHGWYKNEIRIVRNNVGVYSYKDAQSFRKLNGIKLKVKELHARIYHYGYVRPPHLMQSKKKEQDSMHHGIEKIKESYRQKPSEYDYGALGALPLFKGAHPAVMKNFIDKMNWKEKLNYGSTAILNREKAPHEKLKNHMLSFFENKFNKGKDFFGYENWKKI